MQAPGNRESFVFPKDTSAGTGVAPSCCVLTATTPVRSKRQSGFTLVELIITVGLIGIAVYITAQFSSNFFRKARLEGQVSEVRSFLMRAQSTMVNERIPVFIRMLKVGNQWTLSLCRDRPCTQMIETVTLPIWVSFSTTDYTNIQSNWPTQNPTPAVTAPRVLMIDTSGRAFDPWLTIPDMVKQSQWFNLTLKDMVTGKVTPKLVYRIQVYPLWQVAYDKTTY